jgi:cell division protein ZapE
MSAEAEAHDLYTAGHNAHEFVRTVSRLIEMRSHDYLAEAHRVE